MAIKLRGTTWYGDFIAPNGQRVRLSLGTADKRAAQELHDKLKAEAWRTARLGEVPVKTFEDACIRWLDEKQHKRCLDDDKSKIGFWLDHFAGVSLTAITEEAIHRAVSGMTNRKHRANWESKARSLRRMGKPVPPYEAKPVAPATRYSHLAFMRSLLRIAGNEWKWLEKIPNVKCPPPKNNRIRWLNREEAERLINAMPDHFRPVVVFALATGLRRSNIVDLEWSQIDMQRKVAWVHPEDAKAGKAIGVALNDTACNLLCGQLGKHARWVFVHEDESTRPDGTKTAKVRKMRVDANTAWRAGLKRAGIENFRFHDLRHTWASWLVQAGVPLSVLQEMGGWESIEMVRRYAHLAPSHLTEHARQIDAILGGHDTNKAQTKKGSSLKTA